VDARPSRRDVTLVDGPVVVAGAGIGGAATALLLARSGARVTLCERVGEPRAVGAGILLQPNGIAVLTGLGLAPAIRERAWSARVANVADGHGRVLLASPVPDFGRGYDHMLVVRRSHLQRVLVDAVAADDRITCRFGCEVVAAAPDGHVVWRGDAGEESVHAALVVGADGLHSRVRDGGRFAPVRTGGVVSFRALGAPIVATAMSEYWTALGIFGGGPVDGAYYCYGSAGAPAVADALARRDLVAFRRLWADACPAAGRVLEGLASLDDLLVNEATRIDCARWVDGRLVLLGDAAHAMAPNVGQGANSALVDGAVLVDALATAGGQASALATYERRRRAPVRRVQDAAGVLARLGEVRSPVLRWTRDKLIRLVLGRMSAERSVRLGQQEEPVWLEQVSRRRV
jgi:2-polyprenyl-6-methoxyphenol hydroxylase-like FAD-dependent oxidoreductase